MDELDIFIGGQWRRGGGNLMHSQFPADGAINAALHAASLDDLQEAIDRADRAGGSQRGGRCCRISGRRSCIKSPI